MRIILLLQLLPFKRMNCSSSGGGSSFLSHTPAGSTASSSSLSLISKTSSESVDSELKSCDVTSQREGRKEEVDVDEGSDNQVIKTTS